MPFRTHLLVIANQTVGSEELADHLRERARQAPLRVSIVMPVDTEHRAAADERLAAAIQRLRGESIDAVGALSPEDDPVLAAIGAYDPARHDAIVVVTLPSQLSRWLGCDVPQRVGRATGAIVEVVETRGAPVALRR